MTKTNDCHIKFEGITGESSHKDHKGEIEVLTWNWSIYQTSSAGSGSGSGQGRGSPGDFVFTHRYDRASPVLAKHTAAGKHFDTVKFSACKAGDGQKDFLTITMKEVFLTSVSPAGDENGNFVESVHCSYKDIEFAYKPQDAKGNLGGEVKFGWNHSSTEIR